jgi:hypothetical protein
MSPTTDAEVTGCGALTNQDDSGSPATGDWYATFTGDSTGITQESVYFPSSPEGSPVLKFKMRIIQFGDPNATSLSIYLASYLLRTYNQTDALSYPDWTEIEINIYPEPYLFDGGVHNISFQGTAPANTEDHYIIFQIDDVRFEC